MEKDKLACFRRLKPFPNISYYWQDLNIFVFIIKNYNVKKCYYFDHCCVNFSEWLYIMGVFGFFVIETEGFN